MTPRLWSDARQAIHAALSGVMLWLGGILALPGDQLAAQPAFRVLLVWMPEPQWAGLFWFLGCIGIVGLFTPVRWFRLATVLLLATGHGFLAGTAAWTAPHNTASGVYGIYAALGYYLAYRRTVEGL